MSISSMMSIANSGLAAAQSGLRTVSDNVANINTPGYIRKVADQTSVSAGGVGMGVSVAQLRLATDRFLQAAGLKASSDMGAATIRGELLDQAQGLFGDPNHKTSFFNSLDAVFAAFTALSGTPGAASRAAAVGHVSSLLDQAKTISSGVGDLKSQADGRISADVETINGLLKKIDALNIDISRATTTGGDATGAQEIQSQLVDQLSGLMQVQVTTRNQGGVSLRTPDGVLLAGDGGAATLRYQPSDAGGRLFVKPAVGAEQAFNPGSGEIAGLLQTRNVDLPAMLAQLSELTSGAVEALNAAHNAYSAVPPPQSLNGRDTGLPLQANLSGFTGKTNVGVTDAAGALVQSVAIDFDAGTMTVGGTTTSFTAATFLTSLNAALSPAASASFNNGALSLTATTPGDGVVISDDANNPSGKLGKGFSAYFGLNDLITSGGPSSYATGLSAGDPNPFAGSGALTLRLSGPDGAWLHDLSVAMPAGGTVGDMLDALNNPTSGVGLYGAFGLDAQGKLSFSANASGVSLGVVDDTTASSASSAVSLSSLFGLNANGRADRVQGYAVRSDIAADPTRLALAQADLHVAVGAKALSPGDASGADALSRAGSAARGFDAAGDVGATRSSLSSYASRIAAALAGRAGDASGAASSASAIANEAAARRSSREGVNLDQELISMTTYQQAYNASARLIQAAKELYDVLLQMV